MAVALRSRRRMLCGWGDCCMPNMLDREVTCRLKIEGPLLLLAVLSTSRGAEPTFAQHGAGPAGSATSATEAPGPEEPRLPQKAVEIARPFGFPITNSMAVSWIVAVALIIFARVATRDMKRVPSGTQNLLEWLVGGLYDFLERIIGPQLVKRTFWFFATVFIWPNCASSDAARSDPL